MNRNEVFSVFDPLAEFLEEHTYATPEFGATCRGRWRAMRWCWW